MRLALHILGVKIYRPTGAEERGCCFSGICGSRKAKATSKRWMLPRLLGVGHGPMQRASPPLSPLRATALADGVVRAGAIEGVENARRAIDGSLRENMSSSFSLPSLQREPATFNFQLRAFALFASARGRAHCPLLNALDSISTHHRHHRPKPNPNAAFVATVAPTPRHRAVLSFSPLRSRLLGRLALAPF